jgi:hypothetical protein
VELKQVLENLKRSIDKFLVETSRKEEEEWALDQKIESLEEIVLGKSKDYWLIKGRFKGLENWIKIEGAAFNSKSIKKKHIQRIIECVERMKDYKVMLGKDEKFYQREEKVLFQANSFIRENLRKRGWEYTPLGLVDFVQLDESLLKLKEEIGAIDEGGTDLKGKYHKALNYQLDLMDYFYKPRDHLLTILDYQLKNLEVKPSKEDEFFIASLIYYLKQNRYRVEPYLERFRKILRQKRIGAE